VAASDGRRRQPFGDDVVPAGAATTLVPWMDCGFSGAGFCVWCSSCGDHIEVLAGPWPKQGVGVLHAAAHTGIARSMFEMLCAGLLSPLPVVLLLWVASCGQLQASGALFMGAE
jgi:hypothetical protein